MGEIQTVICGRVWEFSLGAISGEGIFTLSFTSPIRNPFLAATLGRWLAIDYAPNRADRSR